MIIGFAGTIGSGKTTAAHYLRNMHRWTLCSFAGALKLGWANMLGIPSALLYEEDFKNSLVDKELFGDLTHRKALQLFGTECMRKHFGDDFWVKLLFYNARRNHEDWNLNQEENIVIDDVRFPNELDAITSRGGKVFRVVRDKSRGEGHASETALNDADLPIIKNDGDLEKLFATVRVTTEPFLEEVDPGVSW